MWKKGYKDRYSWSIIVDKNTFKLKKLKYPAMLT